MEPAIDLQCKERVAESDSEGGTSDASPRLSPLGTGPPPGEVTHRPTPILREPAPLREAPRPMGPHLAFQPTGAVFRDVHSPKKRAPALSEDRQQREVAAVRLPKLGTERPSSGLAFLFWRFQRPPTPEASYLHGLMGPRK